MGTGKTTIGRLLAEDLQRRLVDCDEELEHRTLMTAAQIAATAGRSKLHEIEVELLLAMLRIDEPAVFTAAAFTIEDQRCRAALRDTFVVWLKADPAVLAPRARAQSHRPLGDDVDAQLHEQWARRSALFATSADVILDVAALSPEQAASEVRDAATRHAP